MKLALSVAGLLAALAVTPSTAQAAQTVDVNGSTNASTTGANAVQVLLGAGTYDLTFTTGLYDAFSRFSSSSDCDANGANCRQGFENSVRYVIDGVTYSLGDGAANGGVGPVDPGDGYFATSQLSFANSAIYQGQFTLNAPGNVSFYLYDDFLGDNRGGVSLSIAAVPEPGTWAMMLIGFGAIGYSMRRRKVGVRALAAA